MEDINLQGPIEWVNAKARFSSTPRPEPAIDKVVSEIVGKPIKVNNPMLIKLVVKWKREKGDSDEPDNFFQDPVKVEELKKTL